MHTDKDSNLVSDLRTKYGEDILKNSCDLWNSTLVVVED